MHKIRIYIFIGLFCLFSFAKTEEKTAPEDFKKNLNTLLERSEKSLEILRKQILDNQSAPFLADLYLQLGELLSTKASALYYLEMERQGQSDHLVVSGKQFSPVTETQKEAIQIFERLLKEFPKFEKRAKVSYMLSASLKAIDEIPQFMQVTGKLIAEFPTSIEATRARLLLAQYQFEKGGFDDAAKTLTPLLTSSYNYEKNLAKYRLALIYLAQERTKDSLRLFVDVVTAKDIREEEAPTEVSLKSKNVKSSLKREALIDSIRAFTNVAGEKAEPVEFYLRIAPNETLFYEAIEKLAYRYVSLKRYDFSIKLLRTLSERTNDPQKVVNTYRDILLAIPLNDRADIPPSEIRNLLQKRSQWTAYFEVSKAALNESFELFEKQVRDLATRNHELGKTDKDPATKEKHLARARDYYLLYLGYFKSASGALKMAQNLADVYFTQGRYLESADYYLRLFAGEFGKAANRNEFAENAIAAAQKDGEFSFYEQLRIRGILIRTVKTYMGSSPQLAQNPRLNFILLKARYEQGYYKETVPKLYSFMKQFPGSKQATDAGELVLDYFNTRQDFAGLTEWSGKILALSLPDRTFVAKVQKIQQMAALKKLDATVKSASGFDNFEQGKSYLKSALTLGDQNLQNAALQQALSRSRSEQDIETFMETARILASKETDPAKKDEIKASIGKENIRVTRFYQALESLETLHRSGGGSPQTKKNALIEAVDVALLLRDAKALSNLVEHPLWGQLPPETKSKAKDFVTDLLDSPTAFPSRLADRVLESDSSEATLLSLSRGRDRLSSGLRSQVEGQIRNLCKGGSSSPLCQWENMRAADSEKDRLFGGFDRAPASLSAVEQGAKGFAALSGKYAQFEQSQDPALLMIVTLRNGEIYQKFGDYLKRLAGQNAQLREVLTQRANESYANSKTYYEKCKTLAGQTQAVTPANRFCLNRNSAPLNEMMRWRRLSNPPSDSNDPKSGEFAKLQKRVFAGDEKPDSLLALTEKYLEGGHLHHAAASATVGTSLFSSSEGDFRALLGCSLVRLGLLSEANFNLKKASGYHNIAERCRQELVQKQSTL